MNDPPMADSDLNTIEVLNKEKSKSLWHKYVSENNRHLMLLDENEWPVKLVQTNESFWWQDDWNDNRAEPFAKYLGELNISDSSEILYFWMKETSVRVPWGVFRRNWMNFLFESEGCIAIFPAHDISLVLSNGYCWHGTRSLPCPDNSDFPSKAAQSAARALHF